MFPSSLLSAVCLLIIFNVAHGRPDGDQVAIVAQDSGVAEVDGMLMAVSNEKAIFSQYANRFDIDQAGQRMKLIDVNNPTLVPNGGRASRNPGKSNGLLFRFDPPSANIAEFTCFIESATSFLNCTLGRNNQFVVCLRSQGEFLGPVYFLYSYPSGRAIPKACHNVNLKTELGGSYY